MRKESASRDIAALDIVRVRAGLAGFGTIAAA